MHVLKTQKLLAPARCIIVLSYHAWSCALSRLSTFQQMGEIPQTTFHQCWTFSLSRASTVLLSHGIQFYDDSKYHLYFYFDDRTRVIERKLNHIVLIDWQNHFLFYQPTAIEVSFGCLHCLRFQCPCKNLHLGHQFG